MDHLENLLSVVWALRFHLALIVLAGAGAYVAEALDRQADPS